MIRALFSLVILLGVAATAAAQPVPTPATGASRVKVFLERCETTRKGAIARLEHQLRGLESGHLTAKDPSAAKKKIAAELVALREGKTLIVPTIAYPPEVGAIGRLPGINGHVAQVIDAEQSLITCYFRVQVVTTKNFRPEANAISQPVAFWLRGVPTAEFDVGRDVSLPQVFEVAAQHSYRTTDGQTNSVLLLKPFDISGLKPRGARAE